MLTEEEFTTAAADPHILCDIDPEILAMELFGQERLDEIAEEQYDELELPIPGNEDRDVSYCLCVGYDDCTESARPDRCWLRCDGEDIETDWVADICVDEGTPACMVHVCEQPHWGTMGDFYLNRDVAMKCMSISPHRASDYDLNGD